MLHPLPSFLQRRVQRRWQAYLEGAPLRASEQQQAQQDHQQGDSPRALAGGSPKRPHHELEEVQWCTAPAAGQHLGGSCEVEEGRGKRHRHVAEAHGEEKRSPRSASPTAQLSRHLTEALRSHQGTAEGAAEHQLTRQPKQQQAAAAGEAGEARLADLLAAALQQAVAAGALPAAAYPAPKVQQPGAKQRKLLPAAVTFTTAFPLAVAGLAASTQPAAGGNGTGSSAKLSADAVAALLVQHMPDDVAAAAQVAKGHINFAVPVEDGAGAAGAAGPAAAAGQSTAQALHGKRLQRGASNPSSPTAAGIPRGVPRHFELRTLPCIDSSIVEVEYPLFRKYQVSGTGIPCGVLLLALFKCTLWLAGESVVGVAFQLSRQCQRGCVCGSVGRCGASARCAPRAVRCAMGWPAVTRVLTRRVVGNLQVGE